MTKKELSQLYWLRQEIQRNKERLAQLEDAATNTAAKISGLPGCGGLSDKTALAAEIADLKAIIEAQQVQAIAEEARLTRYIDGVADSFMRQILKMRHIELYSWQEIASKIGGNNTEDGVRKAHDRFLKKSQE